MNVPWSAATGGAIGVPWLLDAIAPGSAFGRRARARERAFAPGDEAAARAALARVDRIAREVDGARLAALRDAIAAAPDPGAALVRAQSGAILADVDFFEIARLLDALAQVRALCDDAALAEAKPRSGSDVLARALEPGATPERTFYLADGFDAELAHARGVAAAAQAALDAARGRLGERVARYAGIEHVRDGEFVLMRAAARGALPPEIRVLREAPTYLLCELALDAASLEALAAREAATARVAEAEEAVRARLSRCVAGAVDELTRACEALGDLDALVARARFAQRYACVLPQIAARAEIAFENARYLPLAEALERRGARYAPISLDLAGIGVLTGPNMGGKSAALRTLGFVTACVALGVPVPATRAHVPLVDAIDWLGIGGDANGDDGLLSAFGREVVALRSALANAAQRPLLLVDEFARTTSPREGRALLVALVEILRARGALGLAATHLSGIAADAAAPHYAIGGLGELAIAAVAPGGDALDLHDALARIARAMDYRIARVDEDAVAAADALLLAGALGLDPALLARARAVL